MQADQTTPTPDQPAAQHQAVLAELTAMGLDIARTLHARITATTQPDADAAGEAGETDEAPAPDLPALAAAFDRMAHCVRRTVLLADHLARPQPDRPLPRLQSGPHPDPAHARRRLLRAMENRITRNDRPVENPDALRRELLDRLDGSDIAADLLTRPLPDLVDELCQDMGLHRLPFVTPLPPQNTPRHRPPAGPGRRPPRPRPPRPRRDPLRPPPPGPPRGTPDAHGITPEDRALHAHILAQGRQRR